MPAPVLPAPCPPSQAPWRWIPPTNHSGDLQMAIDEWLLNEAVAGRSGPVLRIYNWSQPSLSLGWHQRQLEPHWLELPRSEGVALVRRPTGGRAVLHAGALTYALIWPSPPLGRKEAYAEACRWLRASFAAMGQPLVPGVARASGQRSSCFATSTGADLVHSDGAKRIGSAQLWRRNHLLQHGSLLIDPPRRLWQLIFGQDPPALPPLPLAPEALVELLRQTASERLAGGQMLEQPLSQAEMSAIKTSLGRYRVEV